MTDTQRTLFGGSSPEPKRKTKAQKQPQLPAAPVAKLTPPDDLARARNLAAMRKERAKWKAGDIRMSEDPCPECGGERIEELESVEIQGGQTWSRRCLKCSTSL